jgi:hypothetical protein
MSLLPIVRLPGNYVLCSFAFVGVLFLTACNPAPQSFRSGTNSTEWHDFQGTWTATGARNSVHLEGDRRASIANFSGSLVLSGPARPGIGFRSEALVFSDSVTGMIGRAIWTDEHGDQIFSELRGAGTTAHNKIVGTFVGGTGQYSDAFGTYEFSWQFLIENEEGNVQGQSVGLNGRVRVGAQQARYDRGEPHS